MDLRMRKALELLYHHKVDILVKKPVKEGSITKQKLVPLCSDIACRVSLRGQKGTDRGMAASTEYDAKLYLSSDLKVPQGAEFTVTDVTGEVTEYIGGKAFKYSSHQEIYISYKDKVY
ncbi:hypothetical protein V6B05_01705 [Lactococcus garvieae]|uniref:hypothetical protein n=1 Tax=Lactococcus garvieae TaxID=1363 RepID=UPI001F5FFEBB|nr:hypothetical protein [Lactococcus garvieae]MCI3860143.1 hypothetical protein [Lactococcus garvieae]